LVQIRNPAQAKALGIAMVFQHFSLFETLTVAENILLGLSKEQRLKLNIKGSAKTTLAQVGAQINALALEYGLPLEPQRPVHTLSVGERQRVEIMRALLADPKLLILDEPTSVLTPQAVDALFVTLRALAAKGCSILYISHKLDEIMTLCSACTVLRAGAVVASVDPREQTSASLSRAMIGAEPAQINHRAPTPGPLALQVNHLTMARQDVFGVDLQNLHLSVHAGEIVGIAGVSGSGQQELLALLSGEDSRSQGNAIQLLGQSVSGLDPAQRRSRGLHFVPEERLGRGAVPSMSLAANTLLTRADEGLVSSGWINAGNTALMAKKIIERFGVRASGTNALARSLSGGNLQKYLVGREISSQPKVLIVAQPTWGVDVGAAAQIRQSLLDLRDTGCALLVVSEDIDELFEICDRLVVMAGGKLSPILPLDRVSKSLVGQWMSGVWPATPGSDTLMTSFHAP
jgi:general nucleoside transport system ATP-binding protein